MAIYLYAYGKNNLIEDKLSDLEYLKILNNIKIDNKIILESIKDSEINFPIIKHYESQRDNIESYINSMSDDEYKIHIQERGIKDVEKTDLVNFYIKEELEFQQKRKDELNETLNSEIINTKWEILNHNNFKYNLFLGDGLYIKLFNDLIYISGPFDIFSRYLYFIHNLDLKYRNYYHKIFKEILIQFKSEFIFYLTESGLDDEEDLDFNFEKLKFQSNNFSSSESLNEMERFYFEKI